MKKKNKSLKQRVRSIEIHTAFLTLLLRKHGLLYKISQKISADPKGEPIVNAFSGHDKLGGGQHLMKLSSKSDDALKKDLSKVYGLDSVQDYL